MKNIPLSDYDRERYQRQLLLEGWGEEGQIRLRASTVFVAGAGGLGSAAAIYLAEAGVGRLRICDRDKVEVSNLNRQILHSESRIGMAKATSARHTLTELNPGIKIDTLAAEINGKTIDELAGHPDLVIDCLDNFTARYVLNEYCCKTGIPLIHGGLWGMTGQVTFIHPPETPCLKCIFPHAAPQTVVPVAGVTAGIIGCIQASEALKYLTGQKPTLAGKMLAFDGRDLSMTQLKLTRNPKCPVCGQIQAIH
jgi:molybdopterin-synthase adenylyltransferase